MRVSAESGVEPHLCCAKCGRDSLAAGRHSRHRLAGRNGPLDCLRAHTAGGEACAASDHCALPALSPASGGRAFRALFAQPCLLPAARGRVAWAASVRNPDALNDTCASCVPGQACVGCLRRPTGGSRGRCLSASQGGASARRILLGTVRGRHSAGVACCTRWNDIRSDIRSGLSFPTPPRLPDSVGHGQHLASAPCTGPCLPACCSGLTRWHLS